VFSPRTTTDHSSCFCYLLSAFIIVASSGTRNPRTSEPYPLGNSIYQIITNQHRRFVTPSFKPSRRIDISFLFLFRLHRPSYDHITFSCHIRIQGLMERNLIITNRAYLKYSFILFAVAYSTTYSFTLQYIKIHIIFAGKVLQLMWSTYCEKRRMALYMKRDSPILLTKTLINTAEAYRG